MRVEGIPNNVNVNHNHNVVLRVYIDDDTAEHLKDIAKIVGVSFGVVALIRAVSHK